MITIKTYAVISKKYPMLIAFYISGNKERTWVMDKYGAIIEVKASVYDIIRSLECIGLSVQNFRMN